MEKRRLGKTDMYVSVLGFGGAEIGFESATPETVEKLLNSALDAGLNLIDTASAYLESEILIGKAAARRRKEYYLLTKCGATEGFTKADWTEVGILSHIEQSLRNLQTDYLDLIQLHSCAEDELRKGDVIKALQKAREKGYARYIGYSGDGEAAKYAVESGAFDTLQTSISIADQEALDLTLPLAREKGMGVIVKRPVANAAWRTGQKPENSYHHEYWERLKKLDYSFLKKDLATAVAIALRFTLSQPGVHTAIVGTANPNRWQENAELLEAGLLDHQQIEEIRNRWREVADKSWVGQV
ncbi:MAG: aldo/keto reductase [Blastocatellia bacterium]|nr:aldo/keto reductase [Blastocatellia bacterium]